ncbi:uncharacterized protein LOC129951661 [Eupeodes corollae]|uniref:uncharacterized protein LOC129951661 n=1 Tax=Eupeodes corollae TaxID=290404 RepID=UPI002492E274|nr:uncharacterized protein LOC129951661 [Eupeodes corollae]
MLQTPYMIRLCQKIFTKTEFKNSNPSEEDEVLIGICSNWFYQAFDHCTKMTTKPGCTKLWTRIVNLKKLIFQENETALLSDKIPMPVHPELLSLSNCQELSEKVIKDYVNFIPRYMSVMQENRILWGILWSLLEMVVIMLCFLSVRKWLPKYFQRRNASITPEKNSELENILRSDINRILYETKYLSVVPVLNPQLLQVGCPIIGLRIDRKQWINIERIWGGSSGTWRNCENPADADITLMAKKLQRFFHKSGQHLIIVSIEFDLTQDEEIELKKSPRTSFIPVHQKIDNKIGIKRKK